MFNVARLSAVLVVFVVSLAGVVWTTTSAERRIGAREIVEVEAAHDLHDAMLARESALRGYAVSRREGFLEPYDEATAALAAAADLARAYADGDDEEQAAIAEQERFAERWAGIVNDAIIRIKGGRPISVESADARADLLERFEHANESHVELIATESKAAHADAIKRAVLLIVLLNAAFGAAGSLLLVQARRGEQHRQAADAAYHASQREFAETLQVTESEGEAHALVKRHLERSLAGAEIVVLNRKQQPEPAGGRHPARVLESPGGEARRLLTQFLPRSPARPHPRAVGGQRAPADVWPVLAALTHDLRTVARRGRGDRIRPGLARAGILRRRAQPDRRVRQPGRPGARQPAQPRGR